MWTYIPFDYLFLLFKINTRLIFIKESKISDINNQITCPANSNRLFP